MKPIRIIPRLDVKNNNLIKGINLEGLRVLGNPYDYADTYYKNGADELIFNDAIASLYGINSLHKIIRSLANNIYIPICVGGGLKSIKDIEKMFYSGADKIYLNSALLQNRLKLKEVINHFGSPNITVNIEVISYENKYYTSYLSGREISKVNPFNWAKYCQDMGCGEIIITCVENEGLMKGPGLKIFEKMSKIIKVPLLAHGGFGNFKHVYDLIKNVDVSGVIIASLFHYEYINFINHHNIKSSKFGNFSFLNNIKRKKKRNLILELKKYLKKKRINVRI